MSNSTQSPYETFRELAEIFTDRERYCAVALGVGEVTMQAEDVVAVVTLWDNALTTDMGTGTIVAIDPNVYGRIVSDKYTHEAGTFQRELGGGFEKLDSRRVRTPEQLVLVDTLLQPYLDLRKKHQYAFVGSFLLAKASSSPNSYVSALAIPVPIVRDLPLAIRQRVFDMNKAGKGSLINLVNEPGDEEILKQFLGSDFEGDFRRVDHAALACLLPEAQRIREDLVTKPQPTARTGQPTRKTNKRRRR